MKKQIVPVQPSDNTISGSLLYTIFRHFLPLNLLLAGKVTLLLAWRHGIVNAPVFLFALVVISVVFLRQVAWFALAIIRADLQRTFDSHG